MVETLLIITACSLLSSLIFLRMLTAQNNKAQHAYSKHRKEHNQILQETKAERRELKLLLNAFDDALIIVDENHIINVANQAAKTLCEDRKLRGNSVTEAFLNEAVVSAIHSATSDSQPSRNQITLPPRAFGSVKDDHEPAWIIDTAPLPFHDETPLYRVILRDITTEHRTDQIKREFVANASHELRTPLAIINGYMENLLDDDMVEAPATARRFLTTMRKHGDRLSRLIDDMLTISKLESSEAAKLDIETFDLVNVITDIQDRLSPLLSDNGNEIITHFSDSPFSIIGDRFHWEQAIFNLTENALKQNPDRDLKVSISCTKSESGEINITISDNGIGIPSAHLPYIFNRFYRVQKHHSQNEIKGTGLGLSIVKHCIEAHNGTITASSQPGIETVFAITIPAQ